jgi:hypothetical protein
MNVTLTAITKEDFIEMENNAIVTVILDLFDGVVETHSAYRLTGEIFLADIDGVAVITTLVPSPLDSNAYELGTELFALNMNEEVERLISDIGDMPAEELLQLILKHREGAQ